ncbi:BTAD domain-containing putative transcriptional regulator [Nocardioides sp.]|uniref:AfsR/SARP family transcriptional regulator n=1 Tax=Nocardioides sp. TaxID=35761 RepID=UPI0035B44115
MTSVQIDLDVLGPSAARVHDDPVPLGAHKLRSLLGLLVLWRDQPVAADRLIDVLWRGAPPPGAGNTLQGYVAGLRRRLEPGRRARSASSVLLHEGGGYRLASGAADVDADRFEAAVRAGRDHVERLRDRMRPPLLTDRADVARAEVLRDDLAAALRLWRGDAYADLTDLPVAIAERRRLEELRVDARVAEVVLDLSLGRSAGAVDALEDLVAHHPLREELWGLWAVALVRTGRQAHALEVVERLRRTLADDLGIDPGPAIAELQTAVLRQDPTVLGLDDRARTGACVHGCDCHVAPVVVVMVPGDRALGVPIALRDLLVTNPGEGSPLRDLRDHLGRSSAS